MPRNFKIESYLKALQTVHFEFYPEQTAKPEPGYEKIAIYGFGGLFRHVAIVGDGTHWKSKLGEYEDLEHPPAPARMGKYGFRVAYMRRALQYAGDPLPTEYEI